MNPFPKAIVHFDGDSFFASVEQAKNIRLRGKPVVTGVERGIASSMSYEAKQRGVTRGMPIAHVKKLVPDVCVIESDYELYSLYARRMYAIARRFTPIIEEYSIDECFADITDVNVSVHDAVRVYEKIARSIKDTLERELDITFGVGLGPNKSIAKIGSKWKKPAGFTVIPRDHISNFLPHISIGKVWGIGRALTARLQSLGISTAEDFKNKDIGWLVQHRFTKPVQEIWHELRGVPVMAVGNSEKDIQSVIVSRTFSPPSHNAAFIFSELSKNIESACTRLRAHHMRALGMSIYLKTQAFTYVSHTVSLPHATYDPITCIAAARVVFSRICSRGVQYRSSGVSLYHLSRSGDTQSDLFMGDVHTDSKRETLFTAIDTLNNRFGKRAVHLASSHEAIVYRTEKESTFAPRHMLELPFLGEVIV